MEYSIRENSAFQYEYNIIRERYPRVGEIVQAIKILIVRDPWLFEEVRGISAPEFRVVRTDEFDLSEIPILEIVYRIIEEEKSIELFAIREAPLSDRFWL